MRPKKTVKISDKIEEETKMKIYLRDNVLWMLYEGSREDIPHVSGNAHIGDNAYIGDNATEKREEN